MSYKVPGIGDNESAYHAKVNLVCVADCKRHICFILWVERPEVQRCRHIGLVAERKTNVPLPTVYRVLQLNIEKSKVVHQPAADTQPPTPQITIHAERVENVEILPSHYE